MSICTFCINFCTFCPDTGTVTTIAMTSDVQHTLASADLTPSIVTTHPQTGSWAFIVIAVMGVVLVIVMGSQ